MIPLTWGIYNMSQMNLPMKQKQTYRQSIDLWLTRRVRGGIEWKSGASRCKLLYTGWINRVLMYSTENYIQYPVINHMQFSLSVVSDSLRHHESQHARPPCPSPTPGVHSDSRPSSQWCHPAISFSVVPSSSCPQSLPGSESFPMSPPSIRVFSNESTLRMRWPKYWVYLKRMYIDVYLNHSAVQQKLTQCCKSTIFQFKKLTWCLRWHQPRWAFRWLQPQVPSTHTTRRIPSENHPPVPRLLREPEKEQWTIVQSSEFGGRGIYILQQITETQNFIFKLLQHF